MPARHAVCLLAALALLPAALAPGRSLEGFVLAARDAALGRAAPSPVPAAPWVDRFAQLPGGNLLLAFEGLPPDDLRVEYIYYRAVYALWPRRVLLGPVARSVNGSRDILAAVAAVDARWLAANDVSHVVRLGPGADGAVTVAIETPARP
jgi:hypothetical protein